MSRKMSHKRITFVSLLLSTGLPGGPAGHRERLLAKNFEYFYSNSGRKFLLTISPYDLPDRQVHLSYALP